MICLYTQGASLPFSTSLDRAAVKGWPSVQKYKIQFNDKSQFVTDNLLSIFPNNIYAVFIDQVLIILKSFCDQGFYLVYNNYSCPL